MGASVLKYKAPNIIRHTIPQKGVSSYSNSCKCSSKNWTIQCGCLQIVGPLPNHPTLLNTPVSPPPSNIEPGFSPTPIYTSQKEEKHWFGCKSNWLFVLCLHWSSVRIATIYHEHGTIVHKHLTCIQSTCLSCCFDAFAAAAAVGHHHWAYWQLGSLKGLTCFKLTMNRNFDWSFCVGFLLGYFDCKCTLTCWCPPFGYAWNHEIYCCYDWKGIWALTILHCLECQF
jgi:hypothetical protein